MRDLVVNTLLSLDGVMQAPGGPEEDPTGGFEYGGWSVTYWDEMMGEKMTRLMSVEFDLLLGRRTYEVFAAHWPHSDEPGAAQLNAARKFVASRTLTGPAWENTTVLGDDVVTEVRRLKESDGPEIQVHGSADVLQTLLGADLVDELRLWVFPLVLGNGKRLFGDGAVPVGLKLVESATSTTGVIIGTYRRAGDVPIGSFALDEPSQADLERRAALAEG
jgi:dihydrofolate reductase